MPAEIIVTLRLKLDKMDRLIFRGIMKDSGEAYIRRYVISTLLRILKKYRATPLFGRIAVDSVTVTPAKRCKL